MNTKIIYLGMLALLFFTANAGSKNNQQNLDSSIKKTITSSELLDFDNSLGKPAIEIESTSKIMETVSKIASPYKKTIEEIIKEDNQIVESEVADNQPLFLEMEMEDIIRMDNQIIESKLSDEIYKLDFEVINSLSKPTNKNNLKPLVYKNVLKS